MGIEGPILNCGSCLGYLDPARIFRFCRRSKYTLIVFWHCRLHCFLKPSRLAHSSIWKKIPLLVADLVPAGIYLNKEQDMAGLKYEIEFLDYRFRIILTYYIGAHEVKPHLLQQATFFSLLSGILAIRSPASPLFNTCSVLSCPIKTSIQIILKSETPRMDVNLILFSIMLID